MWPSMRSRTSDRPRSLAAFGRQSVEQSDYRHRMSMMITTIRRGLVLAMIGAAAGAIWAWLRDRKVPPTSADSPPLTTADNRSPSTVETNATITAAQAHADAAPDRTRASAAATQTNGSSSTSSLPNAAIDGDEPRSDETTPAWVLPNDDGTTPDTHPIKANEKSGIYHAPGGRFYSRTNPQRCYTTPAAAEADGFRPAKS